jgi:hypothetical protein
VARGLDERVQARGRRAREITLATRKLDGSEFVAEATKFGEAGGDLELFGRRGRREDGDL